MVASIDAKRALALSAPARQRIIAFLQKAGRSADVAELTELLGLNHNAVRKHLARLVEAGIVAEEREPRTVPGRPKLIYRLVTDDTVSSDGPYERLAVLLATALATGEDPVVIGRQASASPGRATTGRATGDAIDRLTSQLGASGFDPDIRRKGRRAEIVLRQCPFVAAAEANPEAVCQLHLGLAQGTADSIGGLRVDGLAAREPRRAGCRLAVSKTT